MQKLVWPQEEGRSRALPKNVYDTHRFQRIASTHATQGYRMCTRYKLEGRRGKSKDHN